MYCIIKLYYFVEVLSLTYTPILPMFFKNKKNVDKIKSVKKRKKRDQNKKTVKKRFLQLWVSLPLHGLTFRHSDAQP